MSKINKRISEVLMNVSEHKGLTSESGEEVAFVDCKYYDNYLLVYYLSQLFENDEIKIEVAPEKMPYFLKLLDLEEEKMRI